MQIKVWALFFDENGKNHCGSDWALEFEGIGEHTLTMRILRKDIARPKDAKGFIILSDYQFFNYSYEWIERLYKKYGKAL